ncbi:hypothetical protein [Neglectibacter caecimuris]|uniref:hypothetical protein n=1 Tax=Neglectibacter caecimuris TaxID=3093658 RepID=UPI002AC960A5|nr:hypothetical protein [Neglectibacter sp. M00184]
MSETMTATLIGSGMTLITTIITLITHSLIEKQKRKLEIRDKYYIAQENYKHFCESDKGKFELYAGQDVRNCLVEFEVEIHNVFISGRSVGNADDPLNNRIEVIRRKLIDSIRNDVRT